MTNQQYLEDLRLLVSTAGWRKHLLPRIKAMRQDHLDHLAYDGHMQPRDQHDIEGCRYAIQLLDRLIAIEQDLATLEASIKVNPDVAAETAPASEDVVESN